MISVIITTHGKRAKLCERAIDSVLNQTYPDFEVLVVDDASEDNTKEVVAKIKDSRVRYSSLKKSRHNQSVVKNKGIRESTGEYIAFLDSDNTYRPDHLRILMQRMELDNKLDVVYGDRWIHSKEYNDIGVFNDFDLSVLLKRNYIDTSDSLIKREALYYIGGWDERYKRYADWNLYLRLGKAGFKFLRIPQVITDYYIMEDSLSKVIENPEAPNYPLWDPYDLEIKRPYLSKISRIEVAVFSITYDRLNYTKKAFRSLKETSGYPYEHFVIDNGSKDGTVEWLKKRFDEKHLILNKDNKGISIASNQALELIRKSDRHEVILKFDNDCFCLTPGWLAKMVDIYRTNHMIALSPYVQGLRDNPGGSPRVGYGRIRKELVGITSHLGGICHFVSKKGYDGWRWPEDEQLHGLQDLEFSKYLISRGFQMAYLENYFVSHGPMGTQAQEKDYPEYFERRKGEKLRTYGN